MSVTDPVLAALLSSPACLGANHGTSLKSHQRKHIDTNKKLKKKITECLVKETKNYLYDYKISL